MPHIDQTDFLIVGSGVAGLATALKASRYGHVRVITKGKIPDSNTRYAQGGIAAAIDPEDSPDYHLRDTLAAGRDLCFPKAAAVLVQDGPQRIRELIEWGAKFDLATDGSLALGREGAHGRNRIVHARGDGTGHELVEILANRVLASPHVEVLEDTAAIDLVVSDGRCVGVAAFGPNGEPRLFLAKAVLLATGGCGTLYKYTTNPPVATGDGFAMAARQSVPLWDMEFVQFHPTALVSDDDPMALISEAVRGEGAFLVNSRGERFMETRHPQADLAPRDVVAREIFDQLQSGTRVFLDPSPIGDRFADRFPTIFKACIERGIDPRQDPIPVAPAAHFIMGGIQTDTDGRTALPGLYACGEVAGTGVHGANRLASNSLLEGLVFAEKVAHCFERERDKSIPRMTHRHPMVDTMSKAPPPIAEDMTAALAGQLREIMWQYAGIKRTGSGLATALDKLQTLEAQLPGGAWTLRNMIETGRLIIRSALERRESRGGHFREDFPNEHDAWRGRHVYV